MINNYIEVLKKYAVFSGRATRREYWLFFLVDFLIMVAFSLLSRALGSMLIQVLGVLYIFALIIPSFAVGVRRLHDTNHSAWWILLGLVPIVGPIVLLVFMVTDSQAGDNAYGPNPKGVLAPQTNVSTQ